MLQTDAWDYESQVSVLVGVEGRDRVAKGREIVATKKG
jgi:hypothetical protein